MRRVRLGIHVHSEPERLRETLAALRAHTPAQAEVLLLPDGPDAAMRGFLSTLGNVPQDGTDAALGPPACFNRLVAHADADVFVLLESGALVAPHWLDRLLQAIDADPTHGLAGPSTNRSWNEQGGFSSAASVDHFGASYQTLEPLYSLADFCYVVKREVIEVIGGGDEAYGLGPCWEMDYNIRAARAGFKGVWARGAYVSRAPFTARRRQAELQRFDTSKRLYQDRFCGLRLGQQSRETPASYEPHCRGDACEHFAPPELVEVHRPLQPAVPLHPEAPLPEVRTTPRQPLISCIMPTSRRPEFALRAVEYFLRQDYANSELIIVDDADSTLHHRLPADPRIHYAQARPGASIGARRNQACAAATGPIIAHWDDDDWHNPGRLRTQAEPLLDGTADIVGLEAGIFFELDSWRFWRCSAELHRRLFVGDVHGGTLMYRRDLWQRGSRYPDTSMAEDAAFLRQAMRAGARLRKLANENLYIYIRHGRNAWSFTPGHYLDPLGWLAVAEPDLPPPDRAFYAKVAQQGAESDPARPLVSCIMPTYNRRRYVGQAIHYFLRQEYPRRELIILDDGDESAADLVPRDARVRYTRLSERLVLGAKRNLACEMAAGDIIVHWDDDDWMSPARLTTQVDVLQHEASDIGGAARQLYYQPSTDQAWLYEYPFGKRRWVAGNTLCYSRKFWQRNRFPEVQVGEDTRFIWSSRTARVALGTDVRLQVGIVHSANTSPKTLAGPFWKQHSLAEVHEILGQDLTFYRELSA